MVNEVFGYMFDFLKAFCKRNFPSYDIIKETTYSTHSKKKVLRGTGSSGVARGVEFALAEFR